jgi:hypothetical protein
MVETKNSKGLKDPVERGKRVVAYLTPEVMADLERVAKHYSLSKSEVIAEAVKDMAAQLVPNPLKKNFPSRV